MSNFLYVINLLLNEFDEIKQILMLLWFVQLQRDFTKEDLTLFRLSRERDSALSLSLSLPLFKHFKLLRKWRSWWVETLWLLSKFIWQHSLKNFASVSRSDVKGQQLVFSKNGKLWIIYNCIIGKYFLHWFQKKRHNKEF